MSSKSEYIQFCKDHSEDIPIFYQPWWLDIVSVDNDWDIALYKSKNGSIQGIWPYINYKKFFLHFIFHPVLTPYSGPFIIYPSNQNKTEKILAYEKKVFSELIKQIHKKHNIVKIKLGPQFTNWLPFYWLGFSQTTHYTYQLDLNEPQALRQGYSSSLRSDIKNVPESIQIKASDDGQLAYELTKNSYRKQNASVYFDNDTFIKLDKALADRNARNIYVAYRNENEPIGCVYTILDRKTAYLPIIGRKELNKNESGIIKKLIDHSIIEASKKGAKTYDFEGSMYPQFERVFRSFGSTQTPYHVLTRLNNLLLKYRFNN